MDGFLYLSLANRYERRPYFIPTTAGKLCNSCLGRIGRRVASDWLAWAVPWYSLNVAVAWQLNVAVPVSALQFNIYTGSYLRAVGKMLTIFAWRRFRYQAWRYRRAV